MGSTVIPYVYFWIPYGFEFMGRFTSSRWVWRGLLVGDGGFGSLMV